jgi:hypothetical protein
MLYVEDLEAAQCSSPDCPHDDHGELFLHGRCHPSAGTRAAFDRKTGLLHLRCRACQAHIVTLVIAHQPRFFSPPRAS